MKTPYAAMFDNFVRSREIDEDDAYWSDQDWAEWRKLLEENSNLE